MRTLRARLESERGSALVTALLVMGIMMSIAIPLMSMVDTQQRMTSAERLHEGSFSLTDAVLNAQVFVLSNSWPSSVADAYNTCTQKSVSLKCPSPTAITSVYTGADYKSSAWAVSVHDDGSSAADYYDESIVNAQPAWDANANGRVWVRADARGTGTTQSLVAQVKMTEHVENFPRAVTTTGYMTVKHIHKNGILTQGYGAQPAPLVLRCTGVTYGKRRGTGNGCLDIQKKKKKWIVPEIIQQGYTGGNALPPAAIDGLRQRAKALGTYYDTCPASPEGELVFVEHGDCRYKGDKKKSQFGVYARKRIEVNSQSNPGAFVVADGSVTFDGKLTYYGIVYAANLSQRTDTLINILKKAQIIGSVAVDGMGGTYIKAHGSALIFDPKAFWDLTSLQGATIVQGSWHEL
jgi:hypothetical protein